MRLSIPAFSFDKTGTKLRSLLSFGPEMSLMRARSESESVSGSVCNFSSDGTHFNESGTCIAVGLINVEPTTRDVFDSSGVYHREYDSRS